MEVDPSDRNIKVLVFAFFFDSKDLVKRAFLFGISDFEAEG